MKILLRSFSYGLIGLISSFIVGLFIFLLLSSLAIVSFDNAITLISFHNQAQIIYNIFTPFHSHIGLSIALLATIFIFSKYVFYNIFLKIINPNFKLTNFENKKQYINVLAYFFFGIMGIGFLTGLLEGLFTFIGIVLIRNIISILISACFWTFFILYWHKDGYMSDLRDYKNKTKIKFKEVIQYLNKSEVNNIRTYFSVLIVLLISNYAFGLALRLALKQIAEAAVIYPESTLSSYFRFFYNLVFGFTFSGFVFLPLVYAFLQDLKTFSKSTFIKLIPVLAVILLIIFSSAGNEIYLKSIDYYKYFLNETGIDINNQNNQNTAIILNNTPEIFSYKSESAWLVRQAPDENEKIKNPNILTLYNELNSTYTLTESDNLAPAYIQCDKHSINQTENFESYLAGKDFKSILANEYFKTLSSCYKLNWETDKYMEILKLSFEKTNSIIDGLVYISARTSWANYDYQKISNFRNFLNSNNYHIGENARKKIAFKFLNYGENRDAKKWFEGTNENLDKIPFTDKFISGIISGKISATSSSLEDLKLGLFIDDSGDVNQKYGITIDEIKNKRLVASTDLDNEGNFKFNNLLEGKYYLGVLIKEKSLKTDDVKINKKISIIPISKENNVYDIGMIDLAINK